MARVIRFLGIVVRTTATAASAHQSPSGGSRTETASILYCQIGGVGLQPPDDPERFFASAVLEVRSPKAVDNLKVTTFDLVDRRSVARARLRRVVNMLEFLRPRFETEGIAAYYGNSAGNRPWNGALPAGVTRLQIRVAFDASPSTTTSSISAAG
jgi:hypothetical protein